MRLVGVVLSVLFTIVTNAQLSSFEGNYLVVGMNGEKLFLEENCWSGNVDEVIIKQNDNDGSASILFSSFHSEFLQIKNSNGDASMLSFEAFNPDEESPRIKKYELTQKKIGDQKVLSLLENGTETLLIPAFDRNNYEFIPCDETEGEGEVIDMSTMYDLSIQIFEALAKADQSKFSEFTTNNGFKYMNNHQEEVLVTISQLFEKNGYASWLRFVRERSSMFTCTDSSTPFDYCTPNNEKPKLMIKTYPEEPSSIDIYVWDTRNNPYRMVIGCTVEGKWLYIKNIIVEICAN